MKIKPNPRGGPGYANICLSPFPSYAHEPYDPPKKKPTGKLPVYLNLERSILRDLLIIIS